MQSPCRYDVLDADSSLVLIFDSNDEYICQTSSEEKAKMIIQKLDTNGGLKEHDG